MKSSISILLAFLVLFASVGMAKTTHFCMGSEMMSGIGFGSKHLECGMGMDMDHQENDADADNDPNSCCNNTTEQLQVDDDVQLKKQHYYLNLEFALALVQVFFSPAELSQTEGPKFKNYISPPLHRDYPVLFASFLI